jgi:hypothetical protein
MFNIRATDLDRLNSMTKYPSILTYHELGERGVLNDAVLTPFPPNVSIYGTEKVDGTNVRLIFAPDRSVLVGSREDLLWEANDLIGNPAMGIVSYFRGIVPQLVERFHSTSIAGNGREPVIVRDDSTRPPIVTIYGEVYGKSIGAAARQYTSSGKVGFRVFDIAVQDDHEDILTWDRQQISHWRENGGQGFLDRDAVAEAARRLALETVPHQCELNSNDLPTSIERTHAFLKQFSETKANLDHPQGQGRAEGIVIRTKDRKTIAKLRFEDYERKRK